MVPRVCFIILFGLSTFLISTPAHSTTIYTWKDANGVVTYSDDPTPAPMGAQIRVLSDYSAPETVSETGLAETTAAQAAEFPAQVVTQGVFAVQLVKELGLGDAPTEKEAADILTNVRIAPRLGRWELDHPMSPELTIRLRNLAIAASDTGRIGLTSDQVLLAFDTTAALLGVAIPVPSAPEEAPPPPYSLAEVPPVVSLEPPPPDIYPYYVWFPVVGGFWYNNFLFPGFFVLNVDGFFFRHHHFHFHDRFHGLEAGQIGRHFRSHIIDHRLIRSTELSGSGTIPRSLSSAGARTNPNGIFNHLAGSRRGSYFPGLRPSTVQLSRGLTSPRNILARPTVNRQSFAPHAFGHLPVSGPPLRNYSVPYPNTRTLLSSSRSFAPSMSHQFGGSERGGGFGHTQNRGFSHR